MLFGLHVSKIRLFKCQQDRKHHVRDEIIPGKRTPFFRDLPPQHAKKEKNGLLVRDSVGVGLNLPIFGDITTSRSRHSGMTLLNHSHENTNIPR